jgi:GntR family transcriptional regulator
MNQNAHMMRDIDRVSPEPFYLQLSTIVEEAIDKGVYAVGDRLPAESEFCRRFELARSTVRETLRTLENKGRIKMVPRRGAFVIDPEQSGWVLQVAAGFFEGEVDYNQRKVETQVLEARLTTFAGAAAEALHLANGEAGFLLRRVRRLDGRVALYSVNYLLPELEKVILGSSVMKPQGSLNRVLRQAGHVIFGARRSLEAVYAPPEIAAILEVPPGSPLLLVTSVSWGKDRRPFDYYTSWVRSDVVKVTVEAGAVGKMGQQTMSVGGSEPRGKKPGLTGTLSGAPKSKTLKARRRPTGGG